MDKFSRIHQLHRVFKARRYPVRIAVLASEMECDEKTVKRAINSMRDNYYAPITYITGKGWQYDKTGDSYELPGLWFSTKELLGLASLLQIVDDMQSELLNEELVNISKLVDALLVKQNLPSDLFKNKITILSKQRHSLDNNTLDQISRGLIGNTRIILSYHSYDDSKTQREISPIKLVHYQENWYLDAYCHLRNKLRSFKVSRILNAHSTDTTSKTIAKKERQEHYQSAYGIFSGQAKHIAVLQFYSDAAREAAMQQWHPKQHSEWNDIGYKITIPYNDDRELIQEILKYANNVEVISPEPLKTKIIDIASGVLSMYHDTS